MKILVINPNPDILYSAVTHIQSRWPRARISTAHSNAGALGKMMTEYPHIIVFDIHHWNTNGSTFSARLTDAREEGFSPLIILMDMENKRRRERALLNLTMFNTERVGSGKALIGEVRLLKDVPWLGYARHELIFDERGEPNDYRFIEANSAFEKLFDLQKSNIIEKSARQTGVGLDPRLMKIYADVALTGCPVLFSYSSARGLRDLEVLVYRPREHQADAVFADISRRMKSEAALKKSRDQIRKALVRIKTDQSRTLQSEKMAVVDQLAAGLAHEINNAAGFIKSNLNTLAEYWKELEPHYEKNRSLRAMMKNRLREHGIMTDIVEQLEAIDSDEARMDIAFVLKDINSLLSESLEGILRIEKIVHDLKDVANPGEYLLKPVDINRCLQAALRFFKNKFTPHSTIETRFGRLPQVVCYAQQISHAFMNILLHSVKAVAPDGIIRVTTTSVENRVVIGIAHDGAATAGKEASRLIDPFFPEETSLEEKSLDLYVADKIVRAHSGVITVNIDRDKAETIFEIELPIHPKPRNGAL